MMSLPKPSLPPPAPRFLWTARGLVFYVLLVILWGAWVRISHSGDGCGDSWPLCNGVVIPEAAPPKTWVEFTHRLMSGAFGLYVLALVIAARKLFAKEHPVRFWAMASLFFTITEALLGAKLVLFGLVGQDDSVFRAIAMSLHFANSVLLVVSVTLLALFAERKEWIRRGTDDAILSARMQKRLPIVAGVVFLILGMSGAIAALSTTLFPSLSLLEGFRADFDAASHFLLRLRTVHPTMGVFAGVGLVLLFYLASELAPANETTYRRRSWYVIGIMAVTVVLGSVTLLWLSPIPLKLVHLCLAHLLGIALTAWWQSLRYRV
ncbi:MAG: COX15/CtaA family protein [Bdellovibrionaceae bacterium]|nr:COX15/CtaA family protein [Pseudobdellovibrionaceae bacterium]